MTVAEKVFLLIYGGAHVIALLTFLRLVWKTRKHNEEMRREGKHHYVVGPF